MSSPQDGIFTEGSSEHQYLEYRLPDGADAAALRAVLGGVLSDAVEPVQRVVAFGPALWSRLAPDAVPPDCHAFAAIDGPGGRSAPATGGDLFFWLHGTASDAVFDAGLAVHGALAPLAELQLNERGFTYHDSRDLTGFIDGTANPKDEAARQAALVPDGSPGAGGSFVLTQRWIHDLAAFGALAQGEQERVIGRTKPDSVELEGEAMPADSHVSRTDAAVRGVAQKIYRRSAPFGRVDRHGLYFLAFACALARFDLLLARMFGTTDDGVTDRLTEFSRPDTGAYWFAPGREALAALN
ncbi:MAG: Dyp-type peroxidase [Alphaproteobacteria bacterium]|jgi:putative iron-dependent peroxidase|nr:Dyp-type peroxidase [Alphaproteobacteria bacterium]MDP6564950.1 Dyp-type peroxidase [Alphaproteobacteria bacterium]MDP6811825.1 Dyp-type peroxidase [Alphaproteobacteria bacterium]